MKLQHSLLVVSIWVFSAQMLNAQTNLQKPMVDHSSMPDMVHDHVPKNVPENLLVPQIELQLFRDTMSGFNLHLSLANFEMGPPEFEQALKQLVSGHAHLYINGKKIQRVYGLYTHLPDHLFQPGINMLMVSLNAHNHDVWSEDNKQIMASIALMKEQDNFILKRFSSSPLSK